VRWEEQRKAQQQDAYNKQEVAKYQDQLARQRSEAEHQKHRERNLELVRLQVLTMFCHPVPVRLQFGSWVMSIAALFMTACCFRYCHVHDLRAPLLPGRTYCAT
jgi:Domain of unknown function (DUF3523)